MKRSEGGLLHSLIHTFGRTNGPGSHKIHIGSQILSAAQVANCEDVKSQACVGRCSSVSCHVCVSRTVAL